MVQERLYFALNCFLIAAIVNFAAWRLGFYQLPIRKPVPKLPFIYLVTVFGIFFLIELILLPMITIGWLYWSTGVFPAHHIKLDAVTKGWINLTAIYLCLAGIGGFFFISSSQAKQSVLGAEGMKGIKQVVRDFFMGSITWFLSYPLVLLISQTIAIALYYIYHGPHVEQVAVKQLKEAFEHPVLFWTTAISVIFIVPFIEELLFRGYLLRWLRGYFRRGAAIAVSAFIFAAFHFALSQGVDNIELLCSLFTLACFLGFLYERQQSLWAPIGLHSTFNAISILMIFLT